MWFARCRALPTLLRLFFMRLTAAFIVCLLRIYVACLPSVEVPADAFAASASYATAKSSV